MLRGAGLVLAFSNLPNRTNPSPVDERWSLGNAEGFLMIF